MDIKKIKYSNFLRLAKEKKDDEPARLARILGRFLFAIRKRLLV